MTTLWRARRGTEAAAGSQLAGDRFVLLDPARLLTIDLSLGALGGVAQVMAAGIGDGDDAPIVEVAVRGASILPPPPVHLRARGDGSGGVSLRWVRRSRAGWRWLDQVDAPLGEEREAYRVSAGRAALTVETAAAALALADLDGAASVTVRQIGAFGLSRAAVIAVP